MSWRWIVDQRCHRSKKDICWTQCLTSTTPGSQVRMKMFAVVVVIQWSEINHNNGVVTKSNIVNRKHMRIESKPMGTFVHKNKMASKNAHEHHDSTFNRALHKPLIQHASRQCFGFSTCVTSLRRHANPQLSLLPIPNMASSTPNFPLRKSNRERNRSATNSQH